MRKKKHDYPIFFESKQDFELWEYFERYNKIKYFFNFFIGFCSGLIVAFTVSIIFMVIN